MGVEINIGGEVILNVKSLVVRASMTTLSNSFSLLVSPRKYRDGSTSVLSFSAGQTASIKINGTSVVNGFVDAVRVSYTKTAHEIEIIGRDRTADFIDSSVPEINVEGAIEFEALLRNTLDTMGLGDIKIINLLSFTSADLTIRADKNVVSEVGQTGFAFIEQFARLKQVLLRGDGNGNIQMTRGTNGQGFIRVFLKNVPDSEGNNIIKGEFVQSNSRRFNTYTVRSQEDFSSPGFTLGVREGVDKHGFVTDPSVRFGRNMTFEAEENSTNEECANRAAWESDLRRASGTRFSVTIVDHTATYTDPGFGRTTTLWQPNFLVQVADVFSNINAIMLIESVRYNISESGGRTTELILVPRDSYRALAAQDAVAARHSLIGSEND